MYRHVRLRLPTYSYTCTSSNQPFLTSATSPLKENPITGVLTKDTTYLAAKKGIYVLVATSIESKLYHTENMVRRFIRLLVAATCCTQASGFVPGNPSNNRLDEAYKTSPLPSQEDSIVLSETSTEGQLIDLPPVIQQIADERREFQVNLGKAMDTLRKDMPYILKRSPGKES